MQNDKIHVEITTDCKSEIVFEPYPYLVKVEQGDFLEVDLLPDGDVLFINLRPARLILWCDAPLITLNGALEADLTWLPTPAPKYDIERVKATVTANYDFEIRFEPCGPVAQIGENGTLTFHFSPMPKIKLHLTDGQLVIECDKITHGESPVASDANNALSLPNVRTALEACLPFLESTGHERN